MILKKARGACTFDSGRTAPLEYDSMSYPVRSLYMILCWFLCTGAVSLAEQIDPRNPQQQIDQQISMQSSTSSWLPARIRELRQQRQELVEFINTLPQHQPNPLTTAFGYHSLRRDPASPGTAGYHTVTGDLVYDPELDSIGMVPAFDPADPLVKTYAFPRRFKIEVMEGIGTNVDGVWKVVDAGEWIEVVNWLEQDFPDPGPYPVVFTGINIPASKVRLSVPFGKGDSTDFFALGELYLIRNEDGKPADNMSVFGSTGIEFSASDNLSVAPFWDLGYVYDGISGLGLPLSERTADVRDLFVEFEPGGTPVDQVHFNLDLGKTERIGRIDIWPTEAPESMAVPLFGFPDRVTVEISNDRDFSESRIIDVENARSRMHNDNFLTVICDGIEARYIRVTFRDLFEFTGRQILGIGEIAVQEYGKIFSTGCDISAHGVPDAFLDQVPFVVDGFSRQRRILSEVDWIIGLAKRKPLDAQLKRVEAELAAAEQDWSRQLFRLIASGGGLLLILGLAGWALQRRERQREVNRLQLQITRDLHDEVGSNLGSSSLTSEQLENLDLDPELKEELGELSLMAREANASLVEVVWMTDQKSVFLRDLIGKLVERAEKVLRKQDVVANVPADCPDLKVRLTAKRHLIAFFKEAIHNCARHARASTVLLSIEIRNGGFHLSIEDNGCGFDPENVHDGWGLGSMKKRANELGGSLEMVSQPAKGTRLELSIPLQNLSMDPIRPYKTSN